VRQTSQNDAAVCSVVIVAAPQMAEIETAIPTAAKKPTARRKSQKVNGRPNHRSSSQATRTASPALQNPLRMEVVRLLSLMTLAATVPTTTPTMSATPIRRPATTKIPAAIPDAGQNTATSEGLAIKESPSWAAKK
jgi:hypothetical protein